MKACKTCLAFDPQHRADAAALQTWISRALETGWGLSSISSSSSQVKVIMSSSQEVFPIVSDADLLRAAVAIDADLRRTWNNTDGGGGYDGGEDEGALDTEVAALGEKIGPVLFPEVWMVPVAAGARRTESSSLEGGTPRQPKDRNGGVDRRKVFSCSCGQMVLLVLVGVAAVFVGATLIGHGLAGAWRNGAGGDGTPAEHLVGKPTSGGGGGGPGSEFLAPSSPGPGTGASQPDDPSHEGGSSPVVVTPAAQDPSPSAPSPDPSGPRAAARSDRAGPFGTGFSVPVHHLAVTSDEVKESDTPDTGLLRVVEEIEATSRRNDIFHDLPDLGGSGFRLSSRPPAHPQPQRGLGQAGKMLAVGPVPERHAKSDAQAHPVPPSYKQQSAAKGGPFGIGILPQPPSLTTARLGKLLGKPKCSAVARSRTGFAQREASDEGTEDAEGEDSGPVPVRGNGKGPGEGKWVGKWNGKGEGKGRPEATVSGTLVVAAEGGPRAEAAARSSSSSNGYVDESTGFGGWT